MPEPYRIRRAAVDDIDAIHELGIVEDGFAVSSRHRFYSKTTLTEWVGFPGDDVLLVAVRGEDVVGLLFCRWHRPRTAVIENVAVRPSERSQGIASLLLEECAKLMSSRHAKSITGIVKEGNNALRFFERNGFLVGNTFQWIEKRIGL